MLKAGARGARQRGWEVGGEDVRGGAEEYVAEVMVGPHQVVVASHVATTKSRHVLPSQGEYDTHMTHARSTHDTHDTARHAHEDGRVGYLPAGVGVLVGAAAAEIGGAHRRRVGQRPLVAAVLAIGLPFKQNMNSKKHDMIGGGYMVFGGWNVSSHSKKAEGDRTSRGRCRRRAGRRPSCSSTSSRTAR
jgi:hypothetical protein